MLHVILSWAWLQESDSTKAASSFAWIARSALVYPARLPDLNKHTSDIYM